MKLISAISLRHISNRKNKSFCLLLPILLFTGYCSAQDAPGRLDSLFTSLYNKEQLNGNVLVAEKGNLLYKHAFGFANIESKQPNSDSTIFKLASISKTVTSVAVLQLKEKGKLNLDDNFTKFFPNFPYPNVTIRQMLSHTSGLPDYDVFKEIVTKDPDKICTNEEIIPEMIRQKMPLLFTPGARWSYCNLNYDLLALLVEKITKQSFGNYIDKNIFAPAGMHHTYIKTALINTNHLPNEAYNYDYPYLFSDKMVRVMDAFYLPRFKRGYYNLLGFVGDGYLYSTAHDLELFDNALHASKLLQLATLEEAYTPTKLTNGNLANAGIGIGKSSFGLGWFILQDTSAGKIVYHTGGDAGCLTIFLRNLTKKQVVILLANTEHPAAYHEGMTALNILNNKAPLMLRKSMAKAYGADLIKKGRDFAIGHLAELKTDSTHYRADEGEFNSLGYQLFNNGYTEQSLEAFKVMALLFPGTGNAWDSYGDILVRLGRNEEAIMMYKRSVFLNPKNDDGKKILEKLIKK